MSVWTNDMVNSAKYFVAEFEENWKEGRLSVDCWAACQHLKVILERISAEAGPWQPIESIPYDEMVLLYNKDGRVTEDFLYDAGPKWLAERGYTHWMPTLKPPQDTTD